MTTVIFLAILYLSILGLTYYFLFRKRFTFSINRTLLIFIPLIALLFSFIKMPYTYIDRLKLSPYAEDIPILPIILEEEFAPEDSTTLYPGKQSPFQERTSDLYEVVKIVYFLGILISILLLIIRINILFRKHRESNRNGDVLSIPNSSDAFTFFKNIYLGDRIPTTSQRLILAHEKVHQRQLHSIDLMYYEVLKIIFWFHPVIYFLQKELRATHEYLADQEVLKIYDKKKYCNDLLNTLFESDSIPFVNSFFNQALLRKRLKMLAVYNRDKKRFAQYLILLPFLLFLTTVSGYMSYTTDPGILEHREMDGITLEKPFNCDYRGSVAILNNCWKVPIVNYIKKNMSAALEKELKLKGNQMIITSFMINECGRIYDANTFASLPELRLLTNKAIQEFGTVIPLIVNGEVTSTEIKFPIDFEIN